MKKHLNILIPAIFTAWLIAFALICDFCIGTKLECHYHLYPAMEPALSKTAFVFFVVLAYALPACAYAGHVIWKQLAISRPYKILFSVAGLIFLAFCTSILIAEYKSFAYHNDDSVLCVSLAIAPLLLFSITMLWRAILEAELPRPLLWQIAMSMLVVGVCQIGYVWMLLAVLIVVVWMVNPPHIRWWFASSVLLGSAIVGLYVPDSGYLYKIVGIAFTCFNLIALIIGGISTVLSTWINISNRTLFKGGYIVGLFITPWVLGGIIYLIPDSPEPPAPVYYDDDIVEEVVEEVEVYDDSITDLCDSIY